MTAAEIIRALGGPTFLATKIEAKRSAISNWPRDGIPAKFWMPLARIARDLHAFVETQPITFDAIEAHTTRAAPVPVASSQNP